ncbi:MAG: transporter [Nitrospirota bacterium]|nr:transporter [Nitrospirota bacterium]
MKKYFLPLIILLLLFLHQNSYSFDVTGLQPTEPYGIFSTFSAESLPKGKFAISTGAEILMEPDFYRFILKGAYGITDNIEFNMTVPYIHKWADTVDGFEDNAFGIKHRFFDEGKYGPSVAYIVTVSLSSGRNEFSTDGRFGIGLIASKRVGPVNGHMNLFYQRPGTGRQNDEFSFLAGLDFAASHNFKFLAELIAKKSHDSHHFDSTEARIGYRILTTDMIYTTLGLGFGLTSTSPEYRIMLSVSFLFPHEKKKIKKVYEEE